MTALTDSIVALLLRELRALRREVEAFPDERDLWRLLPGLANSTGTLTLHVAGSVQHFAGARLAGSPYVRDRVHEFAARDLSRERLLQEVEAAMAAVQQLAAALDGADLGRPFPETVAQLRIETADFLLHMCTHVAYHLGQVDYHRRAVTGSTSGVSAVGLAELKTARPV